MRNFVEEKKTEVLIFRAPRTAVESVDNLAKITGTKRSEVLRRLIPDFRPRKDGTECSGSM